jgi:L-fuconolactonase
MTNSYVDAHHHVWSLARGDYGWLTPALAPLYRDYTLADMSPLANAASIRTTVLVQAAPTVAETRYLLDVARNSNGVVRGVVGWVDLAAPSAVETLRDLATDPLLKSVRPMLQDIADPNWILRADVQPALAALPSLGLRFDALVRPAQLPPVLAMLEHHPDLDVVIDHGAKPEIAVRRFEPWRKLMRDIARHPNVHCKLSGVATEAAMQWSVDDLRPYTDHLLECFGPARLMWGSDWPVVELRGGYTLWRAATTQLLAHLTPSESDAILGATARRFYALGA